MVERVGVADSFCTDLRNSELSTVRRSARILLAFWWAGDENEGMLTMNEPQVWVLIGVFAASIFGMITIVSTLFIHVVKTEIGGIHRLSRDAR